MLWHPSNLPLLSFISYFFLQCEQKLFLVQKFCPFNYMPYFTYRRARHYKSGISWKNKVRSRQKWVSSILSLEGHLKVISWMLLMLKIGEKKPTVNLVDTNKVQAQEWWSIRQVAGFPLVQLEKSGEQGYEGLLILYGIHVVLFNLAVYQPINWTIWVLVYFCCLFTLCPGSRRPPINCASFISLQSSNMFTTAAVYNMLCVNIYFTQKHCDELYSFSLLFENNIYTHVVLSTVQSFQ